MAARERKNDEVVHLDMVRNPFDEMKGIGTQQDMDFIVGVKMFEFHMPGIGTGIEVEKIKQRFGDIIYNNETFFFIVNRVYHDGTCFLKGLCRPSGSGGQKSGRE